MPSRLASPASASTAPAIASDNSGGSTATLHPPPVGVPEARLLAGQAAVGLVQDAHALQQEDHAFDLDPDVGQPGQPPLPGIRSKPVTAKETTLVSGRAAPSDRGPPDRSEPGPGGKPRSPAASPAGARSASAATRP
jgi:hypothetical protein